MTSIEKEALQKLQDIPSRIHAAGTACEIASSSPYVSVEIAETITTHAQYLNFLSHDMRKILEDLKGILAIEED